MTGHDFEVLVAVMTCNQTPADGRTKDEWPTLERVLGAVYSGDPYDRSPEWEGLPHYEWKPDGPSHREATIRSLDRLIHVELIGAVPVPDRYRTPNELAAVPDSSVWTLSRHSPRLTPLGRVVLIACGEKL